MSRRAVATWHYSFQTPGAGGEPLTGELLASQARRILHLLPGFAEIESVTVDRGDKEACYRAMGRSPGLCGFLRSHPDVTGLHAHLGLRSLRGPFEESVVPDGACLTLAPNREPGADGTITLEIFDDLHLQALNAPLLSGFLGRLTRRLPAALEWTESTEHIADARGLLEGLPLAVGQ